jgi:hypothetical protein
MERHNVMASRVGKSRCIAILRTGDFRINRRNATVKGRKPVPF